MANNPLDYVNKVLRYPKAAKMVRVSLSRELTRLEVDAFLVALPSSCAVQTTGKPTTIIVPARHKSAVHALATSMGLE